MDDELRRRFAEAVGAHAVSAHAHVVSPRSVDEVSAAVRVCAETGTPFSVVSGPARDTGRAGDAPLVISLHALDHIELSVPNLTLRAGAGVTVETLRARLGEAHLAVVGLSASVRAERVGDLVARGAVPRRALCGIDAVLPTGESVSVGGGVLKDVVGYDLPALLLGSGGRLAIIASVTFRLEPESSRTPVSEPPGVAADGEHALLARAFDPQGLLRRHE